MTVCLRQSIEGWRCGIEFSEDVLEVATRIYIEVGDEVWDGNGETFMPLLSEEWVSRSRFNRAVAESSEVANMKQAITKIRAGFEWMTRMHHEQLHKHLIEKGQKTWLECDAKTCKFARETVEWIRENLSEV